MLASVCARHATQAARSSSALPLSRLVPSPPLATSTLGDQTRARTVAARSRPGSCCNRPLLLETTRMNMSNEVLMEVSVHDSYTLIACSSALQPLDLELFAIEIPRPQWSGEHFAYKRDPRHARPRALKSAAKRGGTTHSPTAARRHRSRCQGSPWAPLKVRTMHGRHRPAGRHKSAYVRLVHPRVPFYSIKANPLKP